MNADYDHATNPTINTSPVFMEVCLQFFGLEDLKRCCHITQKTHFQFNKYKHLVGLIDFKMSRKLFFISLLHNYNKPLHIAI